MSKEFVCSETSDILEVITYSETVTFLIDKRGQEYTTVTLDEIKDVKNIIALLQEWVNENE